MSPSVDNTKLYCTEKIDFLKEPMFLGSGKNTQRFDNPKYPFFDKANDVMQGFDWKHDEIPLIKDKTEFRNELSEAQKWICTKNLQKLIFLDSIQGRGPMLTLGQICTLPELENCILTWQYFEGAKHSRTYTEQLRAFYDNPDEIFDGSFDIPELTGLAEKIASPFENLYKNIVTYTYKRQNLLPWSKEEDTELRKNIIRLIVEINILEGMRFYAGFASIWGITESSGILKGTTENLELICRDENEHLAITQYLLKLLRKEKSEGFVEIFEGLKDEIHQRYLEAYLEETKWIEFMFSKGSYVGMNAKILIMYLNYITIRRMKSIGLHPKKEELQGLYCTKNPIPWIRSHINSDAKEKLPQEEKITNYVTGGINQDIKSTKDNPIVQKYA